MKPSLELFFAGLVFGGGFIIAKCLVETIWNALIGAVTRKD